MSPVDPMEQVRAIFRDEGTELVTSLGEGLLRLERADAESRDGIVREMMRATHNLKGAAGSLGLKATADLAHALEAVLKEHQHLTDKEAYDTLNGSLDALQRSLDDRRMSSAGEASLTALTQLLAQATGRPASEPQTTHQPPAVASVSAAPATLTEVRAEESARIPLVRLSELMLEVGEVSLRLQGGAERTRSMRDLTNQIGVIAAAMKQQATSAPSLVLQLESSHRGLLSALAQLEAQAARDSLAGEALHDSIRSLRLRPLSTVFRLVPRIARDLAGTLGKEAQVTVSGASLEVEKNLVDVLADVLLHLVRNSMDHGIEAPEERTRRGKPVQGQLHLDARTQGGWLVVELSDDGAGLDTNRLRKGAVAANQLTAFQAANLSEADAHELIFLPGLSTKNTATQVSGRGVGMDAVRAQLERVGGSVTVKSQPGLGTTFLMVLPLQSHRTHVLVMRIGAERFAVPTQAVWKVTRSASHKPVEVSGQPLLMVESVAVPIVQLAPLLWGGVPGRQAADASLVVLRLQGSAVAFAVDELLQDEVVIVRELSPPIVAPAVLSGVALRTGGDVMCVVNAAELIKRAGVTAPVTAAIEARAVRPRARKILVVDDSFTVRALEKSILEMAGYSVFVANDGEDALALLAREDVDLVVSDINMPRKDGFELLASVRLDSRLRSLPFILVTSRASEADRKRGMDLGVSAYVVKSEFDQEILVDAVARLAG